MSAPHTPADPVELTAALIRCASVTPDEGGALVLLADLLTKAGFVCTRCDRNGIANLHARWGQLGNGRVFGFTLMATPMSYPWATAPIGSTTLSGPKSSMV